MKHVILFIRLLQTDTYSNLEFENSICGDIYQLTDMHNLHIKGTSTATLLAWHAMVFNDAHTAVTMLRVRAGLSCRFNCTLIVSLAAIIVCQDTMCSIAERCCVYPWIKTWYGRVILKSHCK